MHRARRIVPILVPLLALATPLAAQQVGIGALEARAATDSNDPIAHYDLAMGYWDQKRWNEAERSLNQAIAISPNYADPYLALSQLALKRGDKYWKEREKKIGEEATRTEFLTSFGNYRRAFLLNPLVDLRLMGKVDLAERVQFLVVNGRLLILDAPRWAHDLEKAINSLNTGKYEAASAQIEKLVRKKPFEGNNQNLPDQLLWWRGLIAAHRDSFAAAVDAFAVLTGRAKAREADSTVTAPSPMQTNDYRFILATLLYLDHRYDHAIPTFRRTLEVDLGLFPAHVQLARMHEARGEMREALAERQLAVDVNPENSDLQVDLAASLIKVGRFADALAPLAEAERLNRRDSRIPYLLGVVHEELQHRATSDSAYARFLAIAPSRYEAQKLELARRLQARSQ
jgi:tetratricopeptide (TPR) repeat protein